MPSKILVHCGEKHANFLKGRSDLTNLCKFYWYMRASKCLFIKSKATLLQPHGYEVAPCALLPSEHGLDGFTPF